MNTETVHIPVLRFPQYINGSEWGMLKLCDIAYIVNERSGIANLCVNTYVSTENMQPNYGGVNIASKLPTTGSYTRFKKGDVLFSNIRPYLKKVWWADFDGIASNDIVVFRAKSGFDACFVSRIIMSDAFITYSMIGAKGVKMPRGDKKMMLNYAVYVPCLEEQKNIANCLFSIDSYISSINEKIEELKAHKKSLMQKLFPQNGKTVPEYRFPEYEKDGIWTEKKLGEYLVEHKMKSDGQCEVYSVSVSKGVVNQIDYLGRSFSASDTSKYKLVKPFDVIYTKSPTGSFPYGIVKQSFIDYNVIVSPLYGVFSPLNKYIGYIIHLYFESPERTNNYLAPIIKKGAKNTIQVSNDTFLSRTVCFPSDVNEQRKIAESLYTITKTTDLFYSKMELLRLQKKGLMQLLFPSSK